MVDQPVSSSDRFQDAVKALPIAHKVMIGASLAVVVLAGMLFFSWISTPSYSVLASGISDEELSDVTTELDSLGIVYEIEAAGARVMVPRSDLNTAKAGLAAAGVNTSSDGGRGGFEILDNQGLAISTNLERINYQRALEGELARTLRAMDRVNDATVHLVLPDNSLFGDPGDAEASVIIDVATDFSLSETDAVSNLVAGAVENLGTENVTIIDLQGRTLQAPASATGGGSLGGRTVLQTLEFEQRLESDVTRLLLSAGAGDRASVMVRADLSYDEVAERTETFDQDNAIAVREQVSNETFSGPGSEAPGGVAGVDGDAGIGEEASNPVDYSKIENTTEYGVNSVVTNVVRAPGKIDSLHVGVVVDDGTLTGATVPDAETLSELITASIGLSVDRGDSLVVTAVPFVPVAELEPGETSALLATAEEPAANPLDMIPQAVGAVVLLAVAIVLILMARKGSSTTESVSIAALPSGSPSTGAVADGAREGQRKASTGDPLEIEPGVRSEVLDLVQRQPEDIATLLRGWLTSQ
jgi:flagellar M-ring protein FliF